MQVRFCGRVGIFDGVFFEAESFIAGVGHL